MAQGVEEAPDSVLAGRRDPEHDVELRGSHLDADAGEEADEDRAGEEVGEERQTGQAGQQQQPAHHQRQEGGELDVAVGAVVGETGETTGHDGRRRRVGADNQVARGAQGCEHGQRHEDRVEAGHDRHARDPRVAHDFGDGEGRQRHTGEYVGADLSPSEGRIP